MAKMVHQIFSKIYFLVSHLKLGNLIYHLHALYQFGPQNNIFGHLKFRRKYHLYVVYIYFEGTKILEDHLNSFELQKTKILLFSGEDVLFTLLFIF